MVGKFLASAAVAGLLLSATVSARPVAAQQAVAGSDSSFIQMAASLGLLQAKLGKIAAEKGSSPSVKEFGKRMAEEYSKANEDLATGAKQAAYPAPVLLRQHKQVVERFLSMGGSSFDKNYMAEVVNDHNEAVRLYQQEAEHGRVASLKELASRMMPAVQQQRALATQTAGSVGADVTATAAGEQKGS
jgi:putative membrane protein